MNDTEYGQDVAWPLPESPRHGYRGETQATSPIPADITIAISREAGARGGSLGRRVARLLGWDVYDQELLDYMARDPGCREDVLKKLSPEASAWVENRVQELVRGQELSQNPSILDLTRLLLALGARGQVVLIGRGAGFVLPRETTLHVRVAAPLADRVAYLAQWLRLSTEEAAEQARVRDSRRQEFLSMHFHHGPEEAHLYDLVLNSKTLGEELCAELVLLAARAKQTAIAPDRDVE
jgi:cytidylate kinase